MDVYELIPDAYSYEYNIWKNTETAKEFIPEKLCEITSSLESKLEDAESALGKDYFSAREAWEKLDETSVSEFLHSFLDNVESGLSDLRNGIKLNRSDIEYQKKSKKEQKKATTRMLIAGIVGSTIGFLFGNIGFLFGDEEFVLRASIVWALIVGGIATYIAYKISKD